MVLWVVIAVGGAGAAGGWWYVAEGPSSQTRIAASEESNFAEKQDKEDRAAEPEDKAGSNEADGEGGTSPDEQAAAEEDKPAEEGNLSPEERLRRSLLGEEAPAQEPPARPKEEDSENEKAKAAAKDKSASTEVAGTGRGESPAKPNEAPATRSIPELVAACQDFKWQPATKQQYALLAELCGRMETAESPQARQAARNAFFQHLQKIEWTPGRVKAVNRYVPDQLGKPGEGVFGMGVVVGHLPDALVLQILGHEESVLKLASPSSRLKNAAEEFPLTTKFVIIGLNTNETVKLAPGEAPEEAAQSARVVESMHLLPATIVEKRREKYGPAPEL